MSRKFFNLFICTKNNHKLPILPILIPRPQGHNNPRPIPTNEIGAWSWRFFTTVRLMAELLKLDEGL